jgi:hypothetical protein
VKSRGSRILLAHAAVVLVLLALFIAMYANIPTKAGPTYVVGLTLPYVPLLVLGLPWSLGYLNDPYAYDDVDRITRLVVMLGPAVLNVVVHGLIRLVLPAVRRAGART